MKDTLSRLLPLTLLLASLAALAACGGEKTREGETATQGTAATQTPETGTTDGVVTFLDGFEAAASQAESPDDLIFVYVGRHSPT